MEKGLKPKKVRRAKSDSAIAKVQKLSLDIQKQGQTSKTLTLNKASALKKTSSSDPHTPKVLQPTSTISTGVPKKTLGTISGSSSTNGTPPKQKLGKKSGSSSSNTKPKKTKKTKTQGLLTADQQKRKNEGIRKTKERREKQVAEKKAGKQNAANNAAVKQQTEITK